MSKGLDRKKSAKKPKAIKVKKPSAAAPSMPKSE